MIPWITTGVSVAASLVLIFELVTGADEFSAYIGIVLPAITLILTTNLIAAAMFSARRAFTAAAWAAAVLGAPAYAAAAWYLLSGREQTLGPGFLVFSGLLGAVSVLIAVLYRDASRRERWKMPPLAEK